MGIYYNNEKEGELSDSSDRYAGRAARPGPRCGEESGRVVMALAEFLKSMFALPRRELSYSSNGVRDGLTYGRVRRVVELPWHR